MVGKNYLLHESPQTKSNIFSALEKEQRRKQRGGDPTYPLLSCPFPFLFSPPAPSPLPFSAPSRSVFRLSSLREWSTIKGLIKTPEQAKAPWRRARLGPARTGRRAAAPIRPRSWPAGRAGGGVRGAGSCSWHGSPKPLLIINLGSSDKKRCISTFRPTPPPTPLSWFLFSVALDVSHPLCPLLKCIFGLAGLSLWFLFFLSPEFYFILFFVLSASSLSPFGHCGWRPYILACLSFC